MLSSMASKIGMLEQDLKSIKEEKKILEQQLAKLSPSNQESKGQGGKNGSDPNTESKKQQDIDEGAGSELAKFNTKLNNDMSMSIPAIPSVNAIKNMGSSQPWTKLLGDSITPYDKKAEVWNWLGKTVVIDRGIGRAPPASHTQRMRQLRAKKKEREAAKKAAEQKTSLKVPAPMEEKQKAGSDGTSWHHELLFKHHNDLLRQPKRKIKQKNASKDTTFVLDNDNSDGEEEKITDPIMHEMNKIPGYQELGDQGAEERFSDNKWGVDRAPEWRGEFYGESAGSSLF